MISVGVKIPKKNILMSLGNPEDKVEFIESVKLLQKMEYHVFATTGTYNFFLKHGIKTTMVKKLSEDKKNNVISMLDDKKFDFVINTPDLDDVRQEECDGYLMRRKAVDKGISLISNIKIAKMFVESLYHLNK